MLVIRFSRVGKKNRAQFRIVAQEHTTAPSGKHIEILGSYDPHFKKGVFKKERIEHWVKNGAQISDSVYNVLVKQGVIKGKKRFVKITAKKEKGKKEGESLAVPDPAKPEKTEEKPEEKKEKAEEAKPEEKEKKPEEKKEEVKEEKKEEKESLATPDPAKPEKTEEVKKEDKKKDPEKKEGK